MDVICVLFLLCSQLKESSFRAVFDFSASLNDVAPIPPISLSVNLVRTEKIVWLVNTFFVCCHFELTPQIKFCECCV